MFFPVSDTIAREHPELAQTVHRLDSYLLECGDKPILPALAADILALDVDLLERLLGLYETHGVVERVRRPVCPQDGEWLAAAADGGWWCDVCESTYAPDETRSSEIVQLAQDADGAEIAATTADPLPAYGQYTALLIGISRYRFMRPLARAATDAQALRALLIDPQGGGYAPARVRLLVDESATRQAISAALEMLAQQVRPSDTVLIFFSGHGVQRQGGFDQGQYLCPLDADMSALPATAISTEQLAAALQAIPAARTLLIVDACHAGALGRFGEPAAAVAAGLSEMAYQRLAGRRGRVLIASSRPEEYSWEPPGMHTSLFTHFLLQGLAGQAARSDGALGILDLYNYLATQVPQQASQHPVLHGDMDGNFAIAPSRLPSARLRRP